MKQAFDIDWQADPAQVVAAVAAHAARIETPCGDGTMVWHRWQGPDDRPPLVLLHGGWGSWTHWIKAIPALAARTTVLAADIPGMGDSADIGRPETIAPVAPVIADGISDLLDDGQRYDIAGFSFGGVASAHVAAGHGSRCRSFTAVGAAGFGPLHYIVQGIQVPDPRLADDEINAIHRTNLKLLMLAHETSIDPMAVHIHRTNIERGRLRSRRISLSTALLDILPDIEASIGGIWGGLDITGGGLVDIEERRALFRAQQPGCQFDIIPDAGHWVMYETVEPFVGTLLRHLEHYDEEIG
ncbi:MAG: alpha/beta hydrolase [Rhodospirillaceae bacterium]|nr:alpha/beta hydrolase [Rhodospirillaceae bacterium]